MSHACRHWNFLCTSAVIFFNLVPLYRFRAQLDSYGMVACTRSPKYCGAGGKDSPELMC